VIAFAVPLILGSGIVTILFRNINITPAILWVVALRAFTFPSDRPFRRIREFFRAYRRAGIHPKPFPEDDALIDSVDLAHRFVSVEVENELVGAFTEPEVSRESIEFSGFTDEMAVEIDLRSLGPDVQIDGAGMYPVEIVRPVISSVVTISVPPVIRIEVPIEAQSPVSRVIAVYPASIVVP
jgi:hypothetical protein